ncbi:rna recognition motif-containing [Holotrichia oblita]|uniref:Rna recognition motif-containing n=1 Tax=Holotrichia oblita TaxID=644536 RepID=A0ACB9TEB5_HOLOL|nr:rna recognition motif-containing [Holotrichia oblita]
MLSTQLAINSLDSVLVFVKGEEAEGVIWHPSLCLVLAHPYCSSTSYQSTSTMSADTALKMENTPENTETQNVQQQDNQNGGENEGRQASHPRRGGGGGGGNRFGNRRQNQDFDNRKGGGRFRSGMNQQNSGERDHRPLHERLMYEKLNELCGPTFELPPLDTTEKKFSGKCRLYIGNIPAELEEGEITDMFKKFGETSEIFINRDKNFGFIKLDYHFNAERAKNEINGMFVKGRTLKIRFAPGSTTLKVKNIDEFVTNELLYTAFSIFGDIERCVVIADERGKSAGEGLVEFARKSSAQLALRQCSDNCFFLTANLRPVLVESYEALDEADGYTEKFIKKSPDYFKQRGVGPRFAAPNSFEEEYGMHWKQLNELYQQKLIALKKENEIEQEKLVAQMEFARYEHETAMLRKQLRDREMDMDRQKREWELREQQAEENKRRTEEQMRRSQEELQSRIMHQEEEMRRRQQENNLFMQAQQLDNMLNNQEQGYDDREGDNSNMSGMDNKPFISSYNSRYESRDMGGRGGQMSSGGGRGGNWDRDFSNKRRRY